MIEPYYKRELANLRELMEEFAADHPALAPLLGKAGGTDPDLERLLEGVAFQTALVRLKIDDDFPEFIQELAGTLCPHYLRPVPATTIVAFSPRPSLTRSETIAAGIELASVPVEGTRCLFRTCAPVEMHPLTLTDAGLHHPPGESPAITLAFSLKHLSLADWSPRSLRLFIGGDQAPAADVYLLLLRHLMRIVITPEVGGRPTVLPTESLSAAGFAEEEAVIPYPPQAYPGFRLLQEYFILPRRFLFLDLVGWDRWKERGNGSGFSLRFELTPLPFPAPPIKADTFVLFATPAVNLFPHDAKPIVLREGKEHCLVRPDNLPSDHARVFSVDRVSGFMQGTGRERNYLPFTLFRKPTMAAPAYRTTPVTSPVHGRYELQLSVVFPDDAALPETETLGLGLTCTNATLPERLRIGDLCDATGTSPQCAEFRNITAITPTVMPRLGKYVLWHLVSHLALNRRALSDAENLRELLAMYLFEECSRDRLAVAANRKRIDGIEELEARPSDRLFHGIPIRGTDLRLRIRGDHFAGPGDLFLFGCVLDRFLGAYAAINSFTRLSIEETIKGENIQWPQRLGRQTLL